MKPSRTVLTILDCLDVDAKRGWGGWIYRNLWFKWPVRRCAAVTTISQASKRDIVRVCGCNPDKVIVTSVAISTRFKRFDKEFCSEFPRILQIGTAPNKNIERVCAALQGLKCKLVIVGRLNDSQRSAVDEYKIDFENPIGLTDDEIIDEYHRADIISFASVFEGFGMPIVEGNVVGRVVVTGNCSSMPEVAGDAACIVNPFSVAEIRAGFLRVIEDVDFRTTLIQKGFINALRFNPDRVAKTYLDVYERIAR